MQHQIYELNRPMLKEGCPKEKVPKQEINQRYRDIQDFVHDINNVIGLAYGYLDLYALSKDERDLLRAREALDKIKCMTEGLLSYSVPSSEKKLIDLDEICLTSQGFFQKSLIKEGIELKFYPDENQRLISGNENQLIRVYLNLIKNASEAIHDYGLIRIKNYCLDGWAVSEITDTGCGIKEENLEKIFCYGFTTKKEGHGIGLSNCKRIIEEHGGRIEVQSELGKGSLFRIYLPLKMQGKEPLVKHKQ